MTSPQNRPPVIERFYTHLDETIAQGLTPEQKEGVENAILASTLASRHQIDIRRSFPFFSKRYYLVFLFGRDLRRQHRQESTLSRMLLTFLLADCRAVRHLLRIVDAVYDQIRVRY